MKRFLLWSFERGSVQYDVICVVILAFIFGMPATFWDDRPDWMRIRSAEISQAKDDDGTPVWVVKATEQQDAANRLKASLGQAVTITHIEPVEDSYGKLVAYAFWIVR